MLKIKSSTFKNIIILVLLVYSIYQTTQLWVYDIVDYNIFYTFLSKNFNKKADYVSLPYYSPLQIIKSLGNNSFEMFYTNNTSNDYQNYEELVKNIDQFKFVEKNFLDYKSFFKNKSYLYKFNIPISAEYFAKSLGKSAKYFQNYVDYFDSIIVLPDTQNTIHIYFYQSFSNEYVKFDFSKSKLNKSFIKNLNYEDVDFLFESSKMLDLYLFKNNVFLPKYNNKKFFGKSISITNPYVDSSSNFELMNNVDPLVSMFFDNRSSIIARPIETDQYASGERSYYYYGSLNKVIKYFPATDENNNFTIPSILEYFDFNNIDIVKNTHFIDDYNAAVKFIEKDELILNDYYLSSYEELEGKRIYYFDYFINNFTINLTRKLKDIIKMNSHIEITIENGNVSRYKKIVYNYEPDEDSKVAININYLNILNAMIGTSYNATFLENIYLSYGLDASEDYYTNLMFYWFLVMDGTVAIKSAQ